MKTTHDNWSLLFQVIVVRMFSKKKGHSCTQQIPACFRHIETVGITPMFFLLKYVVVSIALLHASFFF